MSDGFIQIAPDSSGKRVNLFLPHDRDTEKLVPCAPYIDGEWVYTVEVAPLTQAELDAKAQAEQAKINAQSKAYLDSTDWYVVRFAEAGTPIPADILAARQAARDAIVEPAPVTPEFGTATMTVME